MIRPRDRKLIVGQLAPDIQRQIETEGKPANVIFEMVGASANHTEGIENLIRKVTDAERNSIPMRTIWKRLPEVLGFPDPELHETISHVLEHFTPDNVSRKVVELSFSKSIPADLRTEFGLPDVDLMCRWWLLKEAQSFPQRLDGSFPFAGFTGCLLQKISDKQLNEALVRWGAHITGETEGSFKQSARRGAASTEPEEPTRMRVFISYAREDKDVAKKLYQDLKSAGVEPWMDEHDLLVGQNWKHAITQAIEKSDFFLALLSIRSLSKRGYVQKELRRAVSVLAEMPPTDVYILPVRLDNCRPEDERLKDLNWADLFPEYEVGLAKLVRVFEYQRSLREEDDSAEAGSAVSESDSDRVHETPMPPYDLRRTPMTVSDNEFKKEFRLNESGRPLEYVQNDYHDNGNGTVTDRATGLTWQKSGSPKFIPYKQRQKYIDQINRDRFAGYSDWRLPTVDELASLLEPEEKGKLYIDPIFDDKKWWCWSADERASGGAWVVYFKSGAVYWNDLDLDFCVCAVRP